MVGGLGDDNRPMADGWALQLYAASGRCTQLRAMWRPLSFADGTMASIALARFGHSINPLTHGAHGAASERFVIFGGRMPSHMASHMARPPQAVQRPIEPDSQHVGGEDVALNDLLLIERGERGWEIH